MVDPSSKIRQVLLSCVRGFVSILLVLTVALALWSSMLRPALERDVYVQAACSDEFLGAMDAQLQDHLQSECMFYDLPYERIREALPAETVRDIAVQRMTAVYEAMRHGGTAASVDVSSAPFERIVDDFFVTLPEEERPLDEKAASTIANELADGVELVLNIGISNRLVTMAHKVLAEEALPNRLANRNVWWIAGACVLALLSLLPMGTPLKKRVFDTGGAVFIGSSLAAVPMWLLAAYDLPSRLALGDSALREYVRAVFYQVINQAQTIATTAFAVSAVLLVVAAALLVRQNKDAE